MNKKICDRCGAEIHRHHFPRIELEVNGVLNLEVGAYEHTYEEYELCKKCSEAFERFMKGDADNG